MDATFFSSPDELRAWLEEHHAAADELLVGFYKKDSGRGGISYAEALDQALCYGWIDGVRKRVDADSYTIRFTPRRPASIWSAVNLKRAAELEEQGLLRPAGLRAYQGRRRDRERQYSHEQGDVELAPAYAERLQADPQAWAFFRSQPPSYQRPAIWWVMSAKQEATRLRRLETLIACSQQGQRIPSLRRD